MRKTKIVCTIGPASSSEEVLTEMMLAGMNVARLNFSHGTHEQHQKTIDTIKKVREKLDLPIAIMLDTKGPEYRIKTFKNDKVTVYEGDTFTFTTDEVEGNETHVSVNYKHLCENLREGDHILVDNGLVVFEVVSLSATEAVCKVIDGGVMSNRKSMSFPGKLMGGPYLSEQDKADLVFGIRNGVDFVAASFVSMKEDLIDLKTFMHENGGDGIDIIAKIENRSGVNNIEEICDYCDGIMVARGDLGVEIPFEELPAIQKDLITKCRLLGKRVITATEMLESMINNPRPTRAEISDVANAVYDGTSAIMLSGETAAGKHPVLTVKTMAKIAQEAERNINYEEQFRTYKFKIQNASDAISHATCGMAIDIQAKVIMVCSMSGMTARMVSRFRAPTDIIGMTTTEKAWRKLSLSWGVTPALAEEFPSTEVLFYHAKTYAKRELRLNRGDTIVITGGVTGKSGTTNLIKVETI
ncbi:MAG: pyruvate kinase [Ruminococcaceae bacterium]|nr:pyruvate kinase [Oscillospiraceae bacterium]